MVDLTDNDRIELKKIQRRVKDKRIHIKVTTILMLDRGIPVTVIADVLGIDDSTVYRYREYYNDYEFSDFISRKLLRNASKLTTTQCSLLKEELTHHLYLSSGEIVHYIKINIRCYFHRRWCCQIITSLGF